MRSMSALLLLLATLAGALTACAPANTNTPDPQHANAKPPGNSGASGGGY